MHPRRDDLPAIPVIDTGPGFAMETLAAEAARAQLLMDQATHLVPRAVLRALDKISRRWLVKHQNAYLPEIDAIAERIGRPGAYFLAVNYEWGCTVGLGPSPEGRSARLARTLDWGTPGLGRHVIAARVACPVGPFVTLTWPGFTGILQAMAHGRFTVALNQAPMQRRGGGLFASDWAAARARVWRMPHQLAAHLVRSVVEESPDYATARARLIREPIAAPATFSLAGIHPGETCVIERTEEAAHVVDGPSAATNHWMGLDHGAHSRGVDSRARRAAMLSTGTHAFDVAFPWLTPPILNANTRLVMVADAAEGRLIAQGIEQQNPATAPLELEMSKAR